VAGPCEHDNELLDSVNVNLVQHLLAFKKDSVPWSYFYISAVNFLHISNRYRKLLEMEAYSKCNFKSNTEATAGNIDIVLH
jgi:hypothetical protein